MHETHTQVTADGSKPALARQPEQPAGGALTVRTERRTERRADVLVLWLSGALDKTTSAVLDREFDAQTGHATHVVLDLTGLTLIDSNGLATLLRAHRRASEHDQRTSFGQGTHAGRLPLELTPRRHLLFRPAASEPVRQREHLRHATPCADVDHQRPIVIDPEPPWMGASGQAAGAGDAHTP
jgi:anti-anti-sigma factor